MPPKDTKKGGAKDPSPSASNPQKPRSYQEIYDAHLSSTTTLREDEVETCRADVRVAFANSKLGINAVLGDENQIQYVREHLPKVPLDEVLELPDLGRALVFAVGKVVSRAASPRQIEEKIKAISKPREDMLTQAEILVGRGKLDAGRIAKIRSGSGKYDMATDGVDLVAVYREHRDAIRGMHPFSDEEIEALEANSEWLLERLTPDGARAETKKKSPAEDVRDRLWTLMLRRHPYLRKIGYYLHGDEVDLYVPKLQSRVAPAILEEEKDEESPSPDKPVGQEP